ncbi:MAG: hypothetical protein KY462_08935 [Actinobacteria bacterium]|nr:hypothetical protein [Actinomycetota bacterium]
MPGKVTVLIVLVVLLFVVLVIVGANREQASVDPDDHGWVERFQLRQAPAVEAEHIASGCFDRTARRFLIPALTSCQVEIARAGAPTRLLSLTAVRPSVPAVEIDLAPNNPDDVVIDDWRPESGDFPLKIPVGQDGATATIFCRTVGSDCSLALAD